MVKRYDVSYESDVSISLDFSRGADSRKKILKALGLGSKNCRQIAKIVGLNWNTTHRHLEILLKEDLVRNMQFGQRYFFKLTQKGEDAVKNFKESS